jgi:hypothetical protein
MSNLWLNLRVAYWHLQVGPDRPWVSVNFNRFRWERGDRTPLFEIQS